MKTISLKLKKKVDEIFIVEPADLGLDFLTGFYKKTTRYFKVAPFVFIIPLCFLSAIFLYLIFGSLLIKLVSLLQYGF
ncbi:MAG: hypothetical protein N2482_01120 [Patescibacteria group bacterium]|nr:hypothetical protein [Patescibacteria group bacterium]